MSTLRQFVLWLEVPIESVTNREIVAYIEALLRRRLQAKTINCHLDSIRGFYNYLHDVEDIPLPNPVRRGYVLRLSRPLPRYLRDEEVEKLFEVIRKPRDRAIFMLMLRCGLRVEEAASLSLGAMDLKRRKIIVAQGKGQRIRGSLKTRIGIQEIIAGRSF